VRIYRGFASRVVVVDDYFPCDGNGTPCFAQLPANGDFWCLIVEKAFAKLHGSYQGIIGGHTNEALQAFTGGVPITIHMHEGGFEKMATKKKKSTEQKIWNLLNDISKLEQGNFFAGCSKLSNTPPPNYGHARSRKMLIKHSFGILKLDVVDRIKMVLIRNPWGNDQVKIYIHMCIYTF
jgi:hypothetical protein